MERIKKLKEIIVIDDDEVTCFLHLTLLEDLGVSEKIHCIHDAEEALEYIKEGIKKLVYPDLIILDINMVGMDGFEFLESLRTLETEKKSKFNIFILSASLNDKHKEIASSFEDLLKGYYLKPLNGALVKKIMRLIPHNEKLPKGKIINHPSAGNQKQELT